MQSHRRTAGKTRSVFSSVLKGRGGAGAGAAGRKRGASNNGGCKQSLALVFVLLVTMAAAMTLFLLVPLSAPPGSTNEAYAPCSAEDSCHCHESKTACLCEFGTSGKECVPTTCNWHDEDPISGTMGYCDTCNEHHCHGCSSKSSCEDVDDTGTMCKWRPGGGSGDDDDGTCEQVCSSLCKFSMLRNFFSLPLSLSLAALGVRY